jgi:hypothetical protein
MFHLRDTSPPNAALGEYIDPRLPDEAVFVSRYQSGSARYYSGRITVRWDVIPQEQLDAALDLLRQRGYHPYIVVEEVERAEFAERFRGRSALADLDWTPRAEHASSHVRTATRSTGQRRHTHRRRVTSSGNRSAPKESVTTVRAVQRDWGARCTASAGDVKGGNAARRAAPVEEAHDVTS